ncbi:hypothetical protein PSV08DRAFT_247491 [Bipolaris maydis]|uniref:uncharacterized protein n=1 Tax=Cochliobolus heterostrophus TaxID=5016 RepID=UPI0024DA1C23|nr:hypothetical protein PSV08DRAFT_247491 [Bipolaris maydis]
MCVCVCSQRGHEHEQAEEQEASSKTSLAQGDANRSGYRLPRTRNRSGPEMEAWPSKLGVGPNNHQQPHFASPRTTRRTTADQRGAPTVSAGPHDGVERERVSEMAAGWACSLRETCQKQMEAATRTCRTVGSRLWSREAATRGTEPAPRGAAGRSTGWLVCNDVVAQASSAGPTVPCLRGCTWLPDSPYLPLSSPVPTMPTMPTWGALVVAESCTAWLWPDQQTAGWCRLLQPAMRVRYVNRVYLDIPASTKKLREPARKQRTLSLLGPVRIALNARNAVSIRQSATPPWRPSFWFVPAQA